MHGTLFQHTPSNGLEKLALRDEKARKMGAITHANLVHPKQLVFAFEANSDILKIEAP